MARKQCLQPGKIMLTILFAYVLLYNLIHLDHEHEYETEPSENAAQITIKKKKEKYEK